MAVEFFFMLSGFVLSFAYQQRLDQGRFFWTSRIIRLYPLYFAAFLLGFALLLLQAHISHGWISGKTMFLVGICGLVLLPVPPNTVFANTAAFPVNNPSWSLFGEIVANVIHALFLRRRSTTSLCVMVALLLISILYISHRGGSMDYGNNRYDIYIGLTRVMYSYIVGMLLYRLHTSGRFIKSIPPVVSCLVLLGLLMVRTAPQFQLPMDLFLVIVAFPILLILSTGSNSSPKFARIFRLLGYSSYALYVLQIPFADAFDHVWVRLRGTTAEHDAPWPGVVFFLLIFCIAIAFDRMYDTPIRAALGRRFLRRPSGPNVTALQS